MRAESYFNVGTEIEKLDEEPFGGPPIINSYGTKSLHEQSHGESFFSLLNNRFSGNEIYILDEPEAALSPTRQLDFLARLQQLIGKNSQFVIATHSPIIMSYPESQIIEIVNGKMNNVRYEDTEHYSLTRDFLCNPQQFLNNLFDY